MKNNSTEQTMISKQNVLELAKVHDTNCVSIFIPTHRAGEATLNGKDALNLKNQLKDIRVKLGEQGMSEEDIEKFLQPITNLINDSEFWRHQSDGLAIFLSDKVFQKFTLPIYFEEFNYLSNDFYLKPLLPLFNGDGFFNLLTLKKDEVKFYQGTRHSILEIDIQDIVPSRLEDRVGYDYEQKGLQFRTQQGNKGSGSFHGHQDLDTNEKIELMQFFRAVNKGILTLLHDNQHPPLLICSLDFYFPIYKEVNTYQNLFPQHISGNPTDKDLALLHQEAWALLQPYFNKTRQEKLDKFSALIGTGKTSSEINEIFLAAFEGKIDTLFLENKTDVFGIYNQSTQNVRIDEAHKTPNVSLMNLLAMKVLETDGIVYLIEKDDLPLESPKINVLFRY